MKVRLRFVLSALLLLAPLPALAAAPKTCVTAEEASKMVDKDVCVTAHVYDVVQTPDGTRFLDVCPPETTDDDCGFTIVSLWQDHNEVGELSVYRNRDVRIRGRIFMMRNRAGIFVSHIRQFSGGPPKFKPNPLLSHGFTADTFRPPINDPNLRSHGGRRSFMDARELAPVSKK